MKFLIVEQDYKLHHKEYNQGVGATKINKQFTTLTSGRRVETISCGVHILLFVGV